ncbi:hypothetical protein BDP27DRAFT_1431630 [Rhodocollybia butyracea]|uniref:Uncharacterized protein n=1 Tax=Rhodocollybia butyracea TaxID=206335 RepID=A0A9P5TYD7_9AGAR|nr:hypothetical protein BDP27DRAFT_1431630 [Rhodocollybia butyracea]
MNRVCFDPSIHPVAESSTRRPECPPHIPPHSSPEISQKRAAPSAPEQADCVVCPRLHKSNPSPLESVPTVPPFIPTHPVPSNSNPPASRPAPVPTVEGSGMDERDLPSKFIQTYRSTVRQLQDKKERSVRYRQERERLQDELRSAAARIQGLQADAHVEHNRAEELFARVKTAEASSVLVTEEFESLANVQLSLESQLAGRPMRSESEVDVSRLQESIRHLQGTVDRMQDKLNEAARSFNVLSTQHERLLRRNDRIAETNRRVAREISELEATLVEKKRELDLPGFVRRFEQRVSEPLFRLTNLLRICEDREIVKSPLFVEAYSTLSEATPAITSAACRAQLALRTILEDFDLQFPQVHELLRQSSGSRVVPDLLRNAGIEPAISTIEPIFDFDRTDPESPALQVAIKLLAEFEVIPGLPEQEDEMEDEMEGELEGALQMDVTVTVTPDVEAGGQAALGEVVPEGNVPVDSLSFVLDVQNPLFLPSSEPSSTGSTISMFIIPARLKAIIHSSPPVVDALAVPSHYQAFLRNIKPLVKHIDSPGFRTTFEPEWNDIWNWLRAGLAVIRVYESNALVSDTLRDGVMSFVWPILCVLTHILAEISQSETDFPSAYAIMILEARGLKELLALCVVVAFVETDTLATDNDLYQQWVTSVVSKISGTLKNDFAEALEVVSRSITGLRLTVLWRDCVEPQFMHHTHPSIPGHRLYLFLCVITLPGNWVHSRLDVARSTWYYIYKLWCILTSTRPLVRGSSLFGLMEVQLLCVSEILLCQSMWMSGGAPWIAAALDHHFLAMVPRTCSFLRTWVAAIPIGFGHTLVPLI